MLDLLLVVVMLPKGVTETVAAFFIMVVLMVYSC